jgi:hypothetical protein
MSVYLLLFHCTTCFGPQTGHHQVLSDNIIEKGSVTLIKFGLRKVVLYWVLVYYAQQDAKPKNKTICFLLQVGGGRHILCWIPWKGLTSIAGLRPALT